MKTNNEPCHRSLKVGLSVCAAQRQLFTGFFCVVVSVFASAQAQTSDASNVSAECQSSATYFAEFYAGLQTMHSHGLKNFVPDSADARAYFIQVQKNGEKIEMNVLKGIRGDGNLKPKAKDALVQLTQSVAKTLRGLAEQDAKDDVLRDKASVTNALIQACSKPA